MSIKTVLEFFGLASPSVHLPNENRINHFFRNYDQAMEGAVKRATTLKESQEQDPRRSELKQLRERNESTIARLLREQKNI